MKTPTLSAELKGSTIKIVSEGISQIKVKYYKLDLEVLFSADPLNFDKKKTFSSIKPFLENIILIH